MTYTPTTRDRYRLAVWTTTATLAAGAMAATGWVAGAAAHAQAQDDAVRQAEQAALDAQARAEYDAWLARYGEKPQTQKPRVIVRQHPARTRVTTRYVTAAIPTAAVGAGGSVSTSTASTTSGSQPQQTSSSGSGGGNSGNSGGGGGGQAQAPPPPPPPPTPTSGS